MNLETALDARLWNAVRTSIEARKFTAGVLDAIHLLTDIIRERSGLESDGAALIGAAFGGNSPKLKVNRLQTESEQNIQRGTEAMLRGLYQAIRNPRSHETHDDNEQDATALLLLVDYLLRVVDKSGSPFSVPTLVARILDPDFVPSERYAALLAAEIPSKKRLATCREVFARRSEADNTKVGFFFVAVLSQMSPEENEELCRLVSQELRETTDEGTIRFVLSAFPSSIWPKFDEIARLRIENKLIASVKEGKWITRLKKCTSGALGTWITEIIREVTLKDQLWRAVFSKLDSSDTADQDYAFNFFMGHVKACFDVPPSGLCWRVDKGLKAGDRRFKVLVDNWQWDEDLIDQPNQERPWIKPFEEALEKFTEAEETSAAAEAQEEGIPF